MSIGRRILEVLVVAAGIAIGIKVGGYIGWALILPWALFFGILIFIFILYLWVVIRFKYFHPWDRAQREKSKSKP